METRECDATSLIHKPMSLPFILEQLLKGIRDCSNHESFMKEKHEILKAAKKGGDAHKEISYRNIAD